MGDDYSMTPIESRKKETEIDGIVKLRTIRVVTTMFDHSNKQTKYLLNTFPFDKKKRIINASLFVFICSAHQ